MINRSDTLLLVINNLKNIVTDKASKMINRKSTLYLFILTSIQILINRFAYQLPEDRNL